MIESIVPKISIFFLCCLIGIKLVAFELPLKTGSEMDPRWRLTHARMYDGDSSLIGTCRWHYDSPDQGKVTEWYQEHSFLDFCSVTRYEYDSLGRVCGYKTWLGDSIPESRTVITWYDQGRISGIYSYVFTSPHDSTESHVLHCTTMSTHGCQEWTANIGENNQEHHYMRKSPEGKVERIQRYSSFFRLHNTETYERGPQGEPVRWTLRDHNDRTGLYDEATFDSQGRLTELKKYGVTNHGKRELAGYSVFSYDSEGKLKHEYEYDQNGQLTFFTNFYYEKGMCVICPRETSFPQYK